MQRESEAIELSDGIEREKADTFKTLDYKSCVGTLLNYKELPRPAKRKGYPMILKRNYLTL